MNVQSDSPLSFDEFRIHYLLELGDLTRQAKQEKARRGELPGPAPLGYLNKRTGKTKTTVVVDPDVAPLIQQAFRLASEGFSLRPLLRELTQKGLRSRNGKRLPVAGLWYLLNNPFYMGYVQYKGKLFPGRHEPLVEKATFERVQCNLVGRRKNMVVNAASQSTSS